MSPRPNALGYLVLAGFVGAGVYALTRKAKAADCPISSLGVKRFSESMGVSAIWFHESGTPDAESVGGERIRFPDYDASKDFDSPVIVITHDGDFYRYLAKGNGEIIVEKYPRAKEDYCRINA